MKFEGLPLAFFNNGKCKKKNLCSIHVFQTYKTIRIAKTRPLNDITTVWEFILIWVK